MKIKVYSNSQNIKIGGEFSGDRALETARIYARNMSALTELTLEAGKSREVYCNGILIDAENWEFSGEIWGETDAICLIAKYAEMSIADVARGNLTGLDKAYRAASRRLHPDNQKTGDSEKFIRLRRAYDLLKKTI